jgi:uncharacterized membrane protein YtjA (UPF0391 family)
MLTVVFAFLLIVALLGSLPRWPKSKELSENPMTGLGLMVVVLMLLMVLGRWPVRTRGPRPSDVKSWSVRPRANLLSRLELALEFEMLIASLTFAAATVLVTAFVAIAVVTNRNTRRFRWTNVMRTTMQHYSLLFLSGAILSGLFGFSGIVLAAAAFAKLLACLFLIAFVVPLIPPLPRKPQTSEPVWLRMSRKHAHSWMLSPT